MKPRFHRLTAALLAVVMIAGVLLPITAGPAGAQTERAFRWVSSFDVMDGNGSAVAEIIDTTPNGRQEAGRPGGHRGRPDVDRHRQRRRR